MKSDRPFIKIGTDLSGNDVYFTYDDVSSHVEVVGNSGSGKSYWLEWVSRCLIKRDIGYTAATPHREYEDHMLNWLVESGYTRKLNIFDPSYPHKVVGLDFFWSNHTEPITRDIEAAIRSQAEDLVRETLRCFGWSNSNDFGNIERRLRSLFYTLLERRLSITSLSHFTNFEKHKTQRDQIIKEIQSQAMKEAMEGFYKTAKTQFEQEMRSTINKIQRYEHPMFQRVMGLPDNCLNLARILDKQERLLIQLQPGSNNVAGREINQVFGSLLISWIIDYVLKRNKKIEYFLLIDECAQYIGKSIEEALEQARKFGLHLFLIHQNQDQVREIKGAMQSAQTKIHFSTEERPLPERHFLFKRPRTSEWIEVIAPNVRQAQPPRRKVERVIAQILKNFLTPEEVDARLNAPHNEVKEEPELTYKDFLK